jgi:hypothetical protein
MRNYFAFIDESGVLDESKEVQPFFAVGFLKIADVSLITEKLFQRHYDYYSVQKEKRRKMIQDLKDNPRILTQQNLNLLLVSTRHYEHKFTKITFTTLERYKTFIDTAFEFPLYFCALVIDKNDPKFNQLIYKNYWDAYISYSKLLCKYNLKGDNLCVIADYMNRPTKSDKYFEPEINSLPEVFNTIRAHSETFILLQVVDLLLGSVIFQWRQKNGYVKDSNRGRAKTQFVDHLISKLVIPPEKQAKYPLAQHITINRPFYFNVWPLRLSDIK